MAKQDPFEKKIREKLEGLSSPEDEEAWEKFAPLLHQPSAPFWKHWLFPYLYLSVLFLAGLWWYAPRDENLPPDSRYQKEVTAVVDTVYLRDTVYLIDTVYLYRTSYTQQETGPGYPAGNPLIGTGENISESQGLLDATSVDRSTGPGQPVFRADKPADLGTESRLADTPNGSFSNRTAEQLGVRNDSLVSGRPDPDTGSILAQSADNQPKRKSLAAPAPVAPEEFVMRTDKELVVGDTSNLNQTPVPEKSKATLRLEAGTSLLFPISRLIEYYTPNQQGVHLGVEWDNGWGLYLGAIRNQVEGELDDEEIMALDPALVDGLPEVPQDISSLDEIYLTNRQWFFPLELRWRSPSFAGVSFESGFGIVGNYLSRQDIIYEYENNSELEYRYASDPLRQFTISHVRMGIGTNYRVARRWKLFLRSQYWLPVSRTGLFKDRTHGVEVGVGVHFLLGKLN